MNYENFLKSKVVIAEDYGFEPTYLPKILKPHQKDICSFAIKGGRRAIFASFGLGKTFMQLVNAVNVIQKTDMPYLIVAPLGVIGEFKRDNQKLRTGYPIEYITDTDSVEPQKGTIYITNYERIRKGDIDPEKFGGVSFDEASAIRNLKTKTANFVLNYFKKVKYRIVATATPTPNDYIEILNYADFLGVISRGHALTRFFKRNPTKAGDLTLMENKKDEFWQWVATWAVFINKPSDLGYDDTGYDLPPIDFVATRLTRVDEKLAINKSGQTLLLRDATKSLVDVSRERKDSMEARLDYVLEAVEKLGKKHVIIWHDLESERHYLEKGLKGKDFRSVFGSQPNDLKSKNIIDFSEGKYQILITKSTIAGSGCNFQEYCHNSIYAGISYKFNDFIQSMHRTLRFGQKNRVRVEVVFTQFQDYVYDTLMRKWAQHKELQTSMIKIVREYGLNAELIKSTMERQLFEKGDKVTIGNATLYNNDCVIVTKNLEDNSIDHICTSIPFGDHYEYSDNYNDFGHNHGNDMFFKQMDYLTPELLRVIKPGRVACIHVKDRIRYSYQNGTSFTTIEDFSGKTVQHFTKHGWYLIGKVTITTDVVAENNQTYRLGHSEKCKDGSKMGCGLPEYILMFRKKPTESNNAYADTPVVHTKEEYPVSQWQLDAHAYWRSSGDGLIPLDLVNAKNMKVVAARWKKFCKEGLYDYEMHKRESAELDAEGKISRKYMTLPPHSNNDMVWTDVNRMKTLNANQVSKKKEKHICPLQFDIIERCIELFTNKDEIVFDPFGGLFSVPYKAIEMGRKAVSSELNAEYYADGLYYMNSINYELSVPTLFDNLA